MHKTGLVMEMKGKNAVVMTPDGEFCHTTAKPDWNVGMEVSWKQFSGQRPRHSRIPAWQKTLAAASAACLVLAGGLWVEIQRHSVPQAYAYVSLDINPSIAFTLTPKGRVIHAEGLDADGKTLLKEYNPKGASMHKAVDTVVQMASTQNMLPKDDIVLVTAAPGTTNSNAKQLRQEAQSYVEQAIANNPQAASLHPSVYSMSISTAEWQAAAHMKVSPAQLLGRLIASSAGQNIDISTLSDMKLKQILVSPQAASVLAKLQTQSATQIETLATNMEQKPTKKPVSDTNQTNPGNKSDGNSQQGKGTNKKNGNGNGQALVQNKTKPSGQNKNDVGNTMSASQTNVASNRTNGSSNSLGYWLNQTNNMLSNGPSVTETQSGTKWKLKQSASPDKSGEFMHNQSNDK